MNNVLSKPISGAHVTQVTILMLITLALAAYAIGFSQIEILHDTFHDARHTMNLPCH